MKYYIRSISDMGAEAYSNCALLHCKNCSVRGAQGNAIADYTSTFMHMKLE